MLKKTLYLYALLIAVYIGIGIAVDNSGFYMMFVVLLSTMLPLSALGYDERSHWDRVGLCMPIPRRDIVLSKYALSLFSLVVMALPLVLITALPFLRGTGMAVDLLQILLLSVAGLILSAIQLPFLFWLGVEKGRFVTIAIILLLAFGLPAALTHLPMTHQPAGAVAWVGTRLWVIPLATLTVFCVSACISLAIYRRKDVQ